MLSLSVLPSTLITNFYLNILLLLISIRNVSYREMKANVFNAAGLVFVRH